MGEEQEANAPQNTVSIEEIGPCKKKVTIEIPRDAITQSTDDQYKDLQKDALVPGFRKGRAPRRLLEKRFGKETSEQVKLKLLASASDSAIKDNELNIFTDPDIDIDKIELPAEGPLTFDFEVEVWPEFDLPELEGISVTKAKLEVGEEQVDEEQNQLRRLSGVWAPRQDGPCEAEDRVLADVVMKVEEVEEEEKLDNTEIYVRPNGFVGNIPVETLDEQLTGVKVGDTKEITVEVPKTYFREEYRGKKIEIKIDVKEVKCLQLAEMDAAFLERFESKDETELREKIHDMLDGRLESQARTDMADQIYKYLLDNANFDLPLDVVAQQASTVLQRQYVRLLSQGLKSEQVAEQMESLKASSEDQAKEQLKTFFVIDKVCDKLDIEVTDEEVNGSIAQLAIQRGQRPERMREQMERDGSLSQFKLEIRQNKCISKLLESANIIEDEPSKKDTKSAKKKKTDGKKTTNKPSKESEVKSDD
jgi:trigger factor